MKTPRPEKIKKDFTITVTQAKDMKLGFALVNLNISKWNNLNELASHALTLKRKNAPITASWSLGCYCSTLSKIADNFIRYTELRSFANKLKLYLQDNSTKATYTNIFNMLVLKKEEEEVDKDMNTIADINAKKLTVIASKRLKRTFDKMIENGEESSSVAANESAYDTDEATDEPSDSNISRQKEPSDTNSFQDDTTNLTGSEQIEQPPLTYSVIKKMIIKKANEIHARYQKNQKVTPDERKLMSCGSSLILDLIDKSENNGYKKLFSRAAWNNIVLTFENNLLLPKAKVQENLIERWEYATGLALLSNGYEDSQIYLASIFAKSNSSNQRAVIKLFVAVFDAIQNNPFIMQQEYPNNISEGDYLDQIWLPILKSLFAINGNLVRVKKGETVPAESTSEKSSLYSTTKHIIGFKTDVRFIFDYKESEFDIGAAEACLPNADDTKVTDDEAKLLREGKNNADSLNRVSSGDIRRSWILQLSGLKAYFSTLGYVGHDLYVGVLQNEIVFPSCIGELNDAAKSLAFFKTLFQFRDDVENSAHIIQSKIRQTNKSYNTISNKFHGSRLESPPHTMPQPSSQTWYTPPRNEQQRSIFPLYNHQLLETGSDTVIEGDSLGSLSPSPSADDDSEFATEDSSGLVKVRDGWYHPGLKRYFDHHPLE